MKKKDSATLNAGHSAGLIIAIIGAPLLFLMFFSSPRSTFFFTLFIVSGSLVVCFIADRLCPAKITLTSNEIQIRIRRSKQTISLPWTNFTCLYELPGWKMSIYLLTPAPMDKADQLAAYKACCKNKELPYTHDGCLILNAYVHGSVIDKYLPSHIQKMPWNVCAKL